MKVGVLYFSKLFLFVSFYVSTAEGGAKLGTCPLSSVFYGFICGMCLAVILGTYAIHVVILSWGTTSWEILLVCILDLVWSGS